MDLDRYILEMQGLLDHIETEKLKAIAEILESTEGNIYIIGNGGSASNAEHIANDFMKVAGLSAIALTAVSPLTAYANDSTYEWSFSGPVAMMMKAVDVLLALSVSGTSPNIVAAIDRAYHLGCSTMLLTGSATPTNASARSKSNAYICVNSEDFGMVETVHQAIGHMITDLIKEKRNE